MPMLLRSRRSVYSGQAGGVELHSTLRRSTRQRGREETEESDESDLEPLMSQVMERRRAEMEEAARRLDHTELKNCSVVLDPLQRDPEDKDDIIRKGGRLTSRIPTFHKRAGHPVDLLALKKDTPILSSADTAEISRSKPHATKDTTPLLFSSRVSGAALDTLSVSSSGEAPSLMVLSPTGLAQKSWLSAESGLAASPRPALRLSQTSRRSSNADSSSADPGVGLLPLESAASGASWDDPDAGFLSAGDVQVFDGSLRLTDDLKSHTILDEEPPWQTERALRGSGSSSDADLDGADEESQDEEEGKEQDNQEKEEEFPVASKQQQVPGQAETKVAEAMAGPEVREVEVKNLKGTGSPVHWLLTFGLLLLGGLGHHMWEYGLPMSVSQLTAQLHLHWLEGFVPLSERCSTDCRVQLVESIPEGLSLSTPSAWPSIADSWLDLLDKANSSVHIAAFYFSLRAGDLQSTETFPDSKGQSIFEELKKVQSKGVNLQIAVNAPQTSSLDTAELALEGAEIREVNLSAVSGGIVHTKLWVVDQRHLFLGSANMDWRSLSEVKEVGLSVEDCSCLAQDAFRIFGVYWTIGEFENGSLPIYWPSRLSALSSAKRPLNLKFNGVPARVYLSSAPPKISARGRSSDLGAILSVINDAQKFVYISVMDYLPLSEFTEPVRFWPVIDSTLRAAACTRGVRVSLLVSCWKHSPGTMFTFLQSLLVLRRPPLKCSIDVKIFRVPSTQKQMKIPFARVNHAKFMVTDRALYIGTSNWSENYFTQTAGVGLVVNQTGATVEEGQRTVQSQAEELFLRDWNSKYALPLPTDERDICPRH